MTKKELHLIKVSVSEAWLAMSVYLKSNLSKFRSREDVYKFENDDVRFCQLRSEWYGLSILADRLGVDWSDTYAAEKASQINTEIFRATYYQELN